MSLVLSECGILLCNDGHGDATLAKRDDNFKFLGVIEQTNGDYFLNNEELEKYFVLPKNKDLDLDKVRRKMKGPKYTVNTENYVFEKAR